jgi:hypothetical protein
MGKRTEKKVRKAQKKEEELDEIIAFLESRYKRKIKYTCIHCLHHAYRCEKEERINGYVTDDDLIESSNYKLKHC